MAGSNVTRFCKLREGQRGLCFVRARYDDAIILTTYGRSSGFCIDPIEKKPLNHFLPGTPVLSFGTPGCSLTCKFCQNWDFSKASQFDRLQTRASPKAIALAAKEMGARSCDASHGAPDCFGKRTSLRLHGQCARPGGTKHLLSSLRRLPDRPRLV
jgi:pyruvate formate lyase activating enzyme